VSRWNERGQVVFDRHEPPPEDGVPWWDRLKETGAGAPPLPAQSDWQQWGRNNSRSVTFAAAAEDHLLDFEQVVQAKYEHPTAWMVGLNATQSGSPTDNLIVTVQIIYGLGSGRFVQETTLSMTAIPLVPGPILTVVGPVPAQTIIVSGRAVATSSAAGTFPRTRAFTFGAFVAPQVW
jgi:hypothetical protein